MQYGFFLVTQALDNLKWHFGGFLGTNNNVNYFSVIKTITWNAKLKATLSNQNQSFPLSLMYLTAGVGSGISYCWFTQGHA